MFEPRILTVKMFFIPFKHEEEVVLYSLSFFFFSFIELSNRNWCVVGLVRWGNYWQSVYLMELWRFVWNLGDILYKNTSLKLYTFQRHLSNQWFFNHWCPYAGRATTVLSYILDLIWCLSYYGSASIVANLENLVIEISFVFSPKRFILQNQRVPYIVFHRRATAYRWLVYAGNPLKVRNNKHTEISFL